MPFKEKEKAVAKRNNKKIEINLDFFQEYIKWKEIAISALTVLFCLALIVFGAIVAFYLGGAI